jgi:hypothetical protein
MLLTYSKDFYEKNGPNSYIIARFLQQVPAAAKIRMTFKFLKFHKHLVYNQSYIINFFEKKKKKKTLGPLMG